MNNINFHTGFNIITSPADEVIDTDFDCYAVYNQDVESKETSHTIPLSDESDVQWMYDIRNNEEIEY